ncbi:hypothetical protein BMW23_0242 [Bodo saltans virus]|uniref:Transmembrane protein n=1 Tax=Bodo saltans virus TaxID=2024608 RepID=A0A2H4UTN2_9VIRU|nr:hypothetical protein QJ851_gp0237 [Bodo saltans virus]ATZ80300.1 hypothetical protein BMW23_0242 [Bodo saltans virus]
MGYIDYDNNSSKNTENIENVENIENFDNTDITNTYWFTYSSFTPINIALVILVMILIYNIIIQCFDI